MDSSVGVVVRPLAGKARSWGTARGQERNFWLHRSVQTDFRDHETSCLVDKRGFPHGVERTGRETEYSPPSRIEITVRGSMPSLPHTPWCPISKYWQFRFIMCQIKVGILYHFVWKTKQITLKIEHNVRFFFFGQKQPHRKAAVAL